MRFNSIYIVLLSVLVGVSSDAFQMIARQAPNGKRVNNSSTRFSFDTGSAAAAVDANRKLVVGGNFAFYAQNSESARAIVRITTSGAADSTFNSGSGFTGGTVTAITIQSDSKIIAGGNFTFYNGVARAGLVRINTDGSIDSSFNPGAGISPSTIHAIAVQSNGKIVVGGAFTTYDGTARARVARLNADGSLDTSFDPGAGTLATVSAVAVQSDGKILIGGAFTTYDGTSRSRIARINTNGTLDTSFDPGTGANGDISAIAIQGDGQILIGGAMSQYNGTGAIGIARLNTDGTLDGTFSSGTVVGSVFAIAIQSNGKILVGGNFTQYDGTARNRIARANSNGTIDTGFTPGTGASSDVTAVQLKSNGKIVIGGNFSSYDGTARARVAGLNSDGTLDTGFVIGTGANANILAGVIQSDDKVVLIGFFTVYGATSRNRILRLNRDQTLDTSFDPGTGSNGAGTTVAAIKIQSNGKIIIGGSFLSFNGTGRVRLARLETNGTLDTTFDPGVGPDAQVQGLMLQSNGKIIVTGQFANYAGVGRVRIARIEADGTLDTSFDPGTGPSNVVVAYALQPNGKILIAGNFFTYNGVNRRSLARLNSDGSLDTSFDPGTGADFNTSSMILLPDGKIMIGGTFTTYNGTSVIRLARINSDGTLDTTFNSGTGPSSSVTNMVAQPDGKIIIAGTFTSYNGTNVSTGIARVRKDGSLDVSFVPPGGHNGTITWLTADKSRSVWIGGTFSIFGGVPRGGIVELRP